MKIRTQLSLTFAGLAMFSFIVAGLVTMFASRSVLLAVLTAQHKNQIQMLGSVSEIALSHEELPALWRYMRLLESFPGVTYSYLEGDTGYIWAHTDQRLINQKVSQWKASESGALTLEHAVRVENKGKPVGTAHLGVVADLSGKLTPLIRNAIVPPLLKYGGAALLLSLLLGLVLALLLSRPIQLIAEGAQRVGEGDLDVRLAVASSNELGNLSRTFNDMVGRLRILDEMKDEFIANVSHDLRSPMAAIKMNADFMLNHSPEKESLSSQQKKTLALIMDNSIRLNGFVTNMLDAAKMKAGLMEFHLEPVDVRAVGRNLAALYEGICRHKEIRFRTEIPEALPLIHADPTAFDQVLSNLISNALKFTGKGGAIKIDAKIDGEDVAISVTDTGKGISDEDLDKLFKRYAQAEVSAQRSQKIEGTGLGLYIVKKTVEGMGGEIYVGSKVGKGTCFRVKMPMAPDSAG